MHPYWRGRCIRMHFVWIDGVFHEAALRIHLRGGKEGGTIFFFNIFGNHDFGLKCHVRIRTISD